MATNAGAGAVKQLKSVSGRIAVWKKYTLQSHGIWERIRQTLAIDPNRSTGIPLNPQYRNPPPGANPTELYNDPVTLPSGDIAENPYYKRDVRRNYPRLSIVNQADAVGLLTVGSQSAPKENVLQIGDAGTKQLTELNEEGEKRGLSSYLEKNNASCILGPGGLPPNPSGLYQHSADGGRRYEMDEACGYPAAYPCRTFS